MAPASAGFLSSPSRTKETIQSPVTQPTERPLLTSERTLRIFWIKTAITPAFSGLQLALLVTKSESSINLNLCHLETTRIELASNQVNEQLSLYMSALFTSPVQPPIS
jgi:hypothetical protein